MSNIEKLISEQVLSWSMNEKMTRRNQETPITWPAITISREYGARGRSLAVELGRRTGFTVWDKELLSAIAEVAGADERLLASLDERRRKIVEDSLYGALMGSKLSNTHYFRSLLRVVHTIRVHGQSIIVGRGSNYIIKTQDVLRLRIVCPIEDRVAHVAATEGISEQDSQKLIKARDTERDDFIRYYFKKNSSNPEDYDLVLNSGVFNIEQMADLILEAYQKKTGKVVPHLG